MPAGSNEAQVAVKSSAPKADRTWTPWSTMCVAPLVGKLRGEARKSTWWATSRADSGALIGRQRSVVLDSSKLMMCRACVVLTRIKRGGPSWRGA